MNFPVNRNAVSLFYHNMAPTTRKTAENHLKAILTIKNKITMMRVQRVDLEVISDKYKEYTIIKEVLINTCKNLTAQPNFKDRDQFNEWLESALTDLTEFEVITVAHLDAPSANQVTLEDITESYFSSRNLPNLSRPTSIVSTTASNASEKLRLAKARLDYNSQKQAIENAQFEENQRHSQEAILNDQRQKQDYLQHERVQFNLKQQKENLKIEQESLGLLLTEQALEPSRP